ncbi:tyrosine phosphatase [Oryctes borbonicus]|uniref:protein-tyrosine-phosphatase n=1 Tax=Oryctes borbonicus TaxID=1629725 RepID=A0A0T6BCM1_9SCAR|nr:tyrosine phosphatase [Oryctes borbonicus]
MAKAEDKVDVFRYLQKLREQRVNMVDNVQQYILVHLILLQCLLRKDTSIACDNRLEEIVENITDANIQEEVNGLEDTIWQNKAIRDANPKQQIVVLQEKNRFKNIVPDPSSAVLLSLYPPNKESSTYINAVLVDSYQIASKFIVTQNPLLSTVADFWRMVVENRVTIIVSLNRLNLTDPTTTIFYPLAESYIIEPLPYLEIKYINKEIKGHYEVFDLALTRLDIQENDVTLKIIQINNWGYGMERPENPSELIEVYEEMNYFGMSSDKIVFTCYDGARASGLFAALCVLIDRIKLEQICDVPLAVSTVRQSRKQFVRDPSQFLFLYKCALEYVRKYDVYSIITDTN